MNAMHLLEAMTNIDSDIIENAQPQQKPKGKTVTRLLLLAALIAALTLTAFAAAETVNWFKDYFTRWSKKELTPNQLTFIEEITTDIQKSQTCNGYTITVESAFSDGSQSMIKLKLIAPEGVDLNALNFFPGNDDCLVPTGEEHLTQWDGGWGYYVGDEQPNVADIIFSIHEPIGERTHWTLRIEDIYGTYEENIGESDYRQWTELIVEGTWEFIIVFSDAGSEEMELITDPVAGKVNIGLNKDSYQDVWITSVKLRAMSAEVSYEYMEPVYGSGEFDPIYVVMKDGSQILMEPRSGHTGCSKYSFSVPVIFSDADYVLLPDGTKLPVNSTI